MTIMPCHDCGIDTGAIGEYFTLQHDLWKTLMPGKLSKDFLCVTCLEYRLGRKLSKQDFVDCLANKLEFSFKKSELLINRLTRE